MGDFLPTLLVWRRLRAVSLGMVLAVGGVAAAPAQGKTMLVEPPAPLLPQSAGSLRMSGELQTGSGVPEDAGAAAGVLKEDGLTQWASASYGTGEPTSVRAYRFSDATGALAAYTFLQKAGTAALPGGIAPEGSVSGNDVVLQSGVSVVMATLPMHGAARDAVLREIVQRLPKVGGRQGLPALLPTLVPARGLAAGSVRYALGPAGYEAMHGVLPAELIGFDKAAEAITADYAGRSGTGVLTLLLFPTPQIAGERGRAIESYLNGRAGTQATTTEVKLPPDGPVMQLATGTHAAGAQTVKLRREGPLVLLATGGFSAAEAQELVENIHLRLDVTLDKPVPPEFHVEVRKTASLLVSIATFSGVAGLAAVLLGLFLGFGRAGIRVWMGKPAATEPEFLRLNLAGGRSGGTELPGTNDPSA